EVSGDHDEGRLQTVGGGDREIEIHGLVIEACVLGEHSELRVGHLDEILGCQGGGAGKGKEDGFHGSNYGFRLYEAAIAPEAGAYLLARANSAIWRMWPRSWSAHSFSIC